MAIGLSQDTQVGEQASLSLQGSLPGFGIRRQAGLLPPRVTTDPFLFLGRHSALSNKGFHETKSPSVPSPTTVT